MNPLLNEIPKPIAYAVLLLSFFMALFGAWIGQLLALNLGVPWSNLVAALGGALVLYALSLFLGTTTFVLPYWNLFPLPLATFWAYLTITSSGEWIKSAILTLPLAYWSIRQIIIWFKEWKGFADDRWDLGEARGLVKSFPGPWADLGLHLYPVIVLGPALIPFAYSIMTPGLGPMAIASAVIMSAGLIYWSLGRKTSSYGEMAFWLGAGIGVIGTPYWWTLFGLIPLSAHYLLTALPRGLDPKDKNP